MCKQLATWCSLFVFLFLAMPVFADPPTLKVIKLKPNSAKPAEGLVLEVRQRLQLIADDRTGPAQDQQSFGELVSMGAEIVPFLRQTLLNKNHNFDQRWIAARAIGKIGGPDALATLKGALEGARFSMIRLGAIYGLRDIGESSVVPSLVKALGDEAMIVRSAAADVLAVLGDPSIVPALLAVLDEEENFYKGKSLWVRPHIVAAIGDLRSPTAIPRLVELLDDEDSRVGVQAVRSLEKLTKTKLRVSTTPGQKQQEAALIPKWKMWWEENKSDYL